MGRIGDMKRQIMYLMSGPSQLPYLVCSLYTLRKHWNGEIVVYAWPESAAIVERIAQDVRLNVGWRGWEPSRRGRNAQFECKQLVMQSLDCDVGMYLDADTLVFGDVEPILTTAGSYGFAATQWNDWVTTGRMVGGRIAQLKKIEAVPLQLVDRCLTERWPSVNGGVFACRPSSPVLPVWYEWTVAARALFISDEKVLHILQPHFYPLNQMVTICADGKYNSSPKYRSVRLADEDIVVRHFHGHSNVRPQKSQKGIDMWWPVYQECLKLNVGGIREWRPGVRNKWMDKLEPEMLEKK